MKLVRLTVLALSCITATAFAGSPALRHYAIDQLRSIAEPLFEHGAATDAPFDPFYTGMVEALPLQQRAEAALEYAINRRTGAADYVLDNAAGWRGAIASNAHLDALMQVARDSQQVEVRMAAYELHLAVHGLDKSAAEVDRVLARRDADPARNTPWALYTLGVLGARGVDRARIHDLLLDATRSADAEQRRWAIDSFAIFGGVETVAPLLQIAGHDPSMAIRERAFCGLADSGTLHLAERYEALPGLLGIVESDNTDPQTRSWGYQALREISGFYDLPEQSDAWRERLEAAGLL